MGTPNFASPSNASKYFAVLTNYDRTYKKCKECKHKHFDWGHDLDTLTECENGCENPKFKLRTKTVNPESWECDDFISNMGYAIAEIGGTAENENLDYNNSYNKQSLGYLDFNKNYGDVNINVRLTALLQSAYYEGATLDYLIQIDNGYEFVDVGNGKYTEDVDDVIRDLMESNSDMPIGMQKIQIKHAENWANKTITEASEKLEELFEQYAEHKLGCTGVASNGEAFYHKVA